MANRLQKLALVIGISCLLSPVFAANPSVAKQLDVKNSLLDDAEHEVDKLSAQIEAREKENKQQEINIKRFSLDVKRLSLDAKPSDATQKALNTAQFEVKRAQFTVDKNNKALKQLYADRDVARTKKRSYGLQIDQLKNHEVPAASIAKNEAVKQSQQASAALAAQQVLEKERLRLTEQHKQQLADEKAKQAQLALAAKQAAAQEQLRIAQQQKQQQLADEKAQQTQIAIAAKQAAAQEQLRIAQQQKQQQLAADKAKQAQLALAAQQAAAQEQLRIAEQQKQELARAEAEALNNDQPQFETSAIVDNDDAKPESLPVAVAPVKPLTDFEKLQLLTQINDEQKDKENRYKELNKTVTKSGITTDPLTQQQLVQKRFIENSTTLPPAESALTLAMARSLDAASEQPAWGTGPELQVANPVGSHFKNVGKMKYLGNNQYMMELRVAKGRQQFTLGEYQFIKNIPEHYDGIRCLLLIDARNKQKPLFQLVIAGR